MTAAEAAGQVVDEFADIAPFPDEELPHRLVNLCSDPELIDATCALRFPIASRYLSVLLRPLFRYRLTREVRGIKSRADWHELVVRYIRIVLDSTTDGFTFSGIDAIPRNEPSLFVSNHRDITLDPVLLNYALWLNDFPTSKIAIGDNLLDLRVGVEFMRINNSFIVVRRARGVKAQYVAMKRTSRYIRHVIEKGQSVWIAQREGRSKDGVDKTDPAVLKMLALAYRDESKKLSHMVDQVNLVPITFTYELDPCAPRKAIELAERERTGTYTKAQHEDLDSLVQGITGFKGRVHVAFGAPMSGEFSDAGELAEAIDCVMVANRQPYSTYTAAQDILEGHVSTIRNLRVNGEFTAQWQSVEGRERELLLRQYANQAN